MPLCYGSSRFDAGYRNGALSLSCQEPDARRWNCGACASWRVTAGRAIRREQNHPLSDQLTSADFPETADPPRPHVLKCLLNAASGRRGMLDRKPQAPA